MRALYVGILTDGTTSRMRADALQKLCGSAIWQRINTDIVFRDAERVWKSAAFRFRAGPLVRQINSDVINKTKGQAYDLVWVDKGVYLWGDTVDHLRRSTTHFVHFTPDSAFRANRSRHFMSSANRYDLLVTTKAFEIDDYHELTQPERVMLVTQAYDPGLHRSAHLAAERKPMVVFIGLCEPDREACIDVLLDAGLPVRLGGKGWERFARRHSGRRNFNYLGRGLFGEEYAREYASASVGLGLISKRFPELHTTRTFEIPACGALLATERNAETSQFFGEDEALFFDSYERLAIELKEILRHPEKVDEMSRRGHERVINGGFDYATVLSGVLRRLAIPH